MKRDATVEQLRRKTHGFIAWWVSTLAFAMARSGNGYKRDSLRNSGKGKDRRKDKLGEFFGVPKRFRQYALRYAAMPMKTTRERRA